MVSPFNSGGGGDIECLNFSTQHQISNLGCLDEGVSVFVRLLTTKAVAGGGVACKPGNAWECMFSFLVVENFGDSKKLVTNCVPSAGRVPRSRLWLGASSSLSFAAVALHFSLPSRDQRNSGYLQDRKKFGCFAEVNEENIPILAISSIL